MDTPAASPEMPESETGRRLPTWREMNPYTTPEEEAEWFRQLREMPAWRKFQIMDSLNRATRYLTLALLYDRYPSATEEEIKRRLADLLFGEELAAKAFGPFTYSETTEETGSNKLRNLAESG